MRDVLLHVDECLRTATVQAFELMCFTSLDSDPAAGCGSGRWIVGEVEFHGEEEGALRMALCESTAISVAANFFGESEGSVSKEQVEAVTAELTNVVCGSMLSLVAPDGSFYLSTPHVQESNGLATLPVEHRFRSDAGSISVSLDLRPVSAEGSDDTTHSRSGR